MIILFVLRSISVSAPDLFGPTMVSASQSPKRFPSASGGLWSITLSVVRTGDTFSFEPVVDMLHGKPAVAVQIAVTGFVTTNHFINGF